MRAIDELMREATRGEPRPATPDELAKTTACALKFTDGKAVKWLAKPQNAGVVASEVIAALERPGFHLMKKVMQDNRAAWGGPPADQWRKP